MQQFDFYGFMRIGFFAPYVNVNYSGGINIQGHMWADGLKALGHETCLLNNWDKFDYEEMDIIIILGTGANYRDCIDYFKWFKKIKLVSAPIFDEKMPHWQFKLYSHMPITAKLNECGLHTYRKKIKDISFFLARSAYEKAFLTDCYGIDDSKIGIVPISARYTEFPEVDYSIKEDVCLHVSRLAAPGKNVARLIAAAKKYGFKLRLAGTLNGQDEKDWMCRQIKGLENVEYLGWLSEEQLIEEYRKAKVFALPSIIEGVGMVALEGAIYGDEIVLTNIGAPKEYYNGRAILVDPYSVDSIGKGILEAMKSRHSQPELREHIINNFSLTACIKKLEQYLIEL